MKLRLIIKQAAKSMRNTFGLMFILFIFFVFVFSLIIGQFNYLFVYKRDVYEKAINTSPVSYKFNYNSLRMKNDYNNAVHLTNEFLSSFFNYLNDEFELENNSTSIFLREGEDEWQPGDELPKPVMEKKAFVKNFGDYLDEDQEISYEKVESDNIELQDVKDTYNFFNILASFRGNLGSLLNYKNYYENKLDPTKTDIKAIISLTNLYGTISALAENTDEYFGNLFTYFFANKGKDIIGTETIKMNTSITFQKEYSINSIPNKDIDLETVLIDFTENPKHKTNFFPFEYKKQIVSKSDYLDIYIPSKVLKEKGLKVGDEIKDFTMGVKEYNSPYFNGLIVGTIDYYPNLVQPISDSIQIFIDKKQVYKILLDNFKAQTGEDKTWKLDLYYGNNEGIRNPYVEDFVNENNRADWNGAKEIEYLKQKNRGLVCDSNNISGECTSNKIFVLPKIEPEAEKRVDSEVTADGQLMPWLYYRSYTQYYGYDISYVLISYLLSLFTIFLLVLTIYIVMFIIKELVNRSKAQLSYLYAMGVDSKSISLLNTITIFIPIIFAFVIANASQFIISNLFFDSTLMFIQLEIPIFSNSIYTWVISIGVFVLIFITFYIMNKIALHKQIIAMKPFELGLLESFMNLFKPVFRFVYKPSLIGWSFISKNIGKNIVMTLLNTFTFGIIIVALQFIGSVKDIINELPNFYAPYNQISSITPNLYQDVLTSSVTKDDQTNPKQLNFSHKFIANSYPDEKEIEINTKINLSILELNIKKFPTSSLQSPLGLWIGKNTFDNFYENVCNDLSGLDKTDKVTISITPTLSFTIDDTDLVKKIKTLTMAICTIRSQGTKLYPDLNEFAISLGELYQKNEDDIPFANISLNFNLKEDEYYSTNQRLENFQLLNSNDSYIQTLTQQKLGSTDEMDYNADNITNFANTFYLQNQKVKAIEVTVPQDSYFQIGGIYQLNFRESEFTLRDLTALDISKQEDDAQIDKKVIEEYKNIRNQFRSQVTYNNPSATIFIKPVSSHKSLKLTDTYMADIDEFIEVYKRDIELRNRPEAFQSIYEEINKIQSTFGDEKVPTNYDATTVKNKLNEQIEKVQKFYIETNTQILANQLKLTSEDLKSGLINGFYSKTGVPYFIQNSVILPTGEVDNYLSYTTMNVSTNMNMIDFELLSSLLSNELDTYTGLAENIMWLNIVATLLVSYIFIKIMLFENRTIITLFKSMGYSRYRIGGYMLSGYAVGIVISTALSMLLSILVMYIVGLKFNGLMDIELNFVWDPTFMMAWILLPTIFMAVITFSSYRYIGSIKVKDSLSVL